MTPETHRQLSIMARIVYGEEAWVAANQDETFNVYAGEMELELNHVTVEQAVAHLLQVNSQQQSRFEVALRAIGETE